MKLNEFIVKRMAELGLKRSDLVNKFDIEWSTLGKIAHGHSIRPVTQQKLALALQCSQGEIQSCIAETNPLKKVIVNKKSTAKQKPKKAEPMPEPEPEELPFDDLPEEEPEEGEDMKWYTDVPKDEPEPKKVKVKPAVVSVDVPIPAQKQKAIDKVHEAENLLDEAAEALGTSLRKKAVDALKEIAGQTATPSDNVNHPAHYTQGGIECIEAIKASMTEEEFRGYLKGCQIKYLWRYRLKNGVEDLKKASWYLNRLIVELGGE